MTVVQEGPDSQMRFYSLPGEGDGLAGIPSLSNALYDCEKSSERVVYLRRALERLKNYG